MPRKRTIVVVEDEAPIRRGIVDVLTLSGYEPVEAADGAAGLTEARRAGVDLVLLDLALPKLDGLDVLAGIRQTHPTLPVIILTARGSENDRVRGLKEGADDYVVKPFSARELLARVEAVLRRSPDRPAPLVRVRHGNVVVDCARREIHSPTGETQALSDMEADILNRLVAHRDRAVSREELLGAVWGIRDGQIETRAIDMHITRLRNKLAEATKRRSHEATKEETDAASPSLRRSVASSLPADASEWIATVRGKGYMLGGGVEVLAEGSDEGSDEATKARSDEGSDGRGTSVAPSLRRSVASDPREESP